MTDHTPQPDQIILRWLPVEETDDQDLEARGLEILSPDERQRYRRFRYDRDRRLYLAAHILLRATLAELLEPGFANPDATKYHDRRHVHRISGENRGAR